MSDLDRRFDAAINPYGCSPAVVTALTMAVEARTYRHYGDPCAGQLCERLAAHFGLSPGNFIVYNGSGEGLVWQALTHLLLPRGVFICPYPSYERFVDVGRRCAQALVEFPLETPSWRLPVDRFIDEARRSQASMAMISTPNNPTGNCLLDETRLCELLTALPACTVVIDEAYAEYAGFTFSPLVRRFQNLVLLKTFSKAYGLAGLRVGYVVGHESTIAGARRFQIPWAVDTLALVAAEAALQDREYLRTVVERIKAEVEVFGRALAALPFLRVSPTDANFHFVELQGLDYERLKPVLEEQRLVVRRRVDMPEYLRITSMTPEANRVLLDALLTV